MSRFLEVRLVVFRFLIQVFLGSTYCLYKKRKSRRAPGVSNPAERGK